jgi:hypothetical protein
MNTNTNGRTERKTLASQLDRLDLTIDALADGLNKFVADAVREAINAAVSQTVEAVLRELLARPKLLRQLAGPSVPPTATAVEPAKPSLLRRLVSSVGQKIRLGWAWIALRVGARAIGVKEQALATWQRIRKLPTRMREVLKSGWRHRRRVGVAMSGGLLTGLCSYAAGPILAAIACGVGSVMLILGMQAVLPYWGLLKSLANHPS